MYLHIIISLSTVSSLNLLKWKNEQGQEQTICLVREVSASWDDFGMILGFSFNELDSWKSEYQGNTRKCWNKVMESWLSKGGTRDYPSSWKGLCTLLNDLGFAKISQVMQRAAAGQSTSC